MPKINANNCEMYYEVDDYTDPWLHSKETVWLQHGVGRSSRFWYHWVPALAGEYRVVRRDMRGHGQSAAPEPDHVWSVDELINDITNQMRATMNPAAVVQNGMRELGRALGATEVVVRLNAEGSSPAAGGREAQP